jgi:nucleotide-binding universal stress UspA family protein
MKTKTFHILLPTDFSDNAWNAIVYALKLYADEFCTFYFLHSRYILNPVSRTYITTSHYVDKLKEQALKELAELKTQTEVANANANHDFKTLLFENELMDAVCEAVKQNAIDIVIMGTKGATGSMDYLFGSNTVKVANKIKDCPILIIPDEHDFVTPKQIAFPTDYNRFYDNELKPLKSMADLFNSKIRVVHINIEKELSSIQKYNMTMLENYLADYECSFHWLPDYTKKSEAITAFIEDLEIEMLAMVKYKHSLLETIINEPVIKKLVFHPKVPILVMPE